MSYNKKIKLNPDIQISQEDKHIVTIKAETQENKLCSYKSLASLLFIVTDSVSINDPDLEITDRVYEKINVKRKAELDLITDRQA
jgi:hypothetical protein